MSPTYTEQNFEAHIEEHLLASGYHACSPATYDKELCLLPEEVIAFVRATQPQEYKKLAEQYGAETDQKLVYRLAREISKRGALDVLRKGIKDRGVKLKLAYFKPANSMNPEHQKLFQEKAQDVQKPDVQGQGLRGHRHI